MKALINKTFSDWKNPATTPKIVTPSATQKNLQGVFVVNQPQLTQSSVLLGHLGGRLDSPDYPALTVLNEILSGFGGRLFNEVRSRQGLAYSVYGIWNSRYDYPGLFIAGGQTRTDATVPFIKQKEVGGLFTSTTPTLLGGSSITEAHISTITDSIILLRYVEMYGEMRRGITVLKMRGSMHDKDIREFSIDHQGMHIGQPFRNVTGILAGTPMYTAQTEVERLSGLFEDRS